MAGTDLITVAAHETLPQLHIQLRDYARASSAASTRRVYGSSWRSFCSWCASVGVEPLPAEAAHVALYLTARAPTTAVATLALHLSAIAAFHQAAGCAAPAHPDLDRVWAGIRRTHGRPPVKKRALVVEDLRRVLAKLPDDLAGKRDRAILLLGFAGALRRSELAKASMPGAEAGDVHVEFVAKGMEIHLVGAKGDQRRQGEIVSVPYGTRICPVAALQAWISAAGIVSGPIFRRIDRHGNLGAEAISDRTVALVVKAACERVGLDPAAFAGHSLRSGLITSADDRGAAPKKLQAHARHKKFETTAGYIQAGERFKGNAAGKAGL